MKRKRIAGIACFTAIALIAGCGGGKDMSLKEKFGSRRGPDGFRRVFSGNMAETLLVYARGV